MARKMIVEGPDEHPSPGVEGALLLEDLDDGEIGEGQPPHGGLRELLQPSHDLDVLSAGRRYPRRLALERSAYLLYEDLRPAPPAAAVLDVGDVVPGLEDDRQGQRRATFSSW